MKSKTLLPFAAVALVMFATAFVLFNTTGKAVAGSQSNAPAISVATTSTAVAVTSSTRLVASTTAPGAITQYTRGYLSICNPNANPVYILLDGDKPASATKATAVIAAAAGYNVCYELTDAKMIYNGSVTASSTNQTSTTVTVADYVY